MTPILDAFAVLGIGRTKGYRLIADGEFPIEVKKIGGVWKVRTADLRRYAGDIDDADD